MNKASLIEKISGEVPGVNKKQVEGVIDSMTGIITNEIKNNGEVSLTGFGTFLSRVRHARNGVNPQRPNERIQIPEVRVAKFKTGKNLKDALKS